MTDADSSRELESPYRLLDGDVRLLIGLLATLTGTMIVDPPTDVLGRVLQRLVRDGALNDVTNRGEAVALLDDLCQQLRFAHGEYGDVRPVRQERAWTHHVTFRDEASATAFADAAQHSQSLGMSLRADDDGLVRVFIAFADLPPDPGFVAREAALTELARQHGGRYEGAAGGGLSAIT